MIPQKMLLDIAKIEQGVIIDLYDIDLSEIVGNKTVLRFHNGLNELRRPITWQGNVYEPYPIKAQGFEKNGQGTSNRPTLTSSNVQDILNGLIESKAASPILRLFASDDVNPDEGFIKAGFAHVNDEAKNAYAKKIAVGHYEIHGSLGFAKEGWYITLPEDANGNKKFFADYSVDENNIITIKTYTKKFDTNRCEIVAGDPIDITKGRWIDVRLDMMVNDPPYKQSGE